MSYQRKRTIQICRRAAYLMLNSSAGSIKVLGDRELIARCYQIN